MEGTIIMGRKNHQKGKTRSFSKDSAPEFNRRKKNNPSNSSKPVVRAQTGQVVVNGYSEQWLRQQFDWVYRKEVMAVGENVQSGSIIEIVTVQGQSMGTGVYADTSGEQDVVVRRFSEHVEPLDLEFFQKRIQSAVNRRSIEKGTNAWRLIHSENDDLPGFVVDCWGESISVTLSCASLKVLLEPFLEALERIYPYQNAVGHVRLPHGKQAYLGVLKGAFPDRFVVEELGIQYWVHPQLSKDAGLFLDMRALRSWLIQQDWTGKRMLNLFCYTGAFSVSAGVHGAKEVVSVDLSTSYLDRARENFRLNSLNVETHQFIDSDTFVALNRFRRKEELFDTVLADPPSFSHSSHGTWSVQKDLKRLVIACLRVLKPGGTLIIATNHGKMPPRDFSKAILDAARKEKRRLRLMLNYVPGTDFPAALHFPEARYLKCWVMEAS